MVCISVLSPILLRIGCRRMLPVQLDKRPTGLTPTHALETGLPVSALLGTLLLCWYSPLSDVLQSDVAWGQVIICHFIVLFFGCPIHTLTLQKKQVVPMFLICPPALAATLACILRGFRRKQTIGSCVLLTTAMVVRRQAYLAHLGSKEVRTAYPKPTQNYTKQTKSTYVKTTHYVHYTSYAKSVCFRQVGGSSLYRIGGFGVVGVHYGMSTTATLVWNYPNRFFNATLSSAYASAPLPVLGATTVAHTVSQGDYHAERIGSHTLHRPPQPHSASVGGAFAARDASRPNKRRRGTDSTCSEPILANGDDVSKPLTRIYKLRMHPNAAQRRELRHVFDVCRDAYNFANQHVKQRIREDPTLNVTFASSRVSVRQAWVAAHPGESGCPHCVATRFRSGAFQQLASAYKSNEAKAELARRRGGTPHVYEIQDIDCISVPTETVSIEGGSHSQLRRFERRGSTECLAYFGNNLEAVGPIRIVDSRRGIDRVMADGGKLEVGSQIQWDKRTGQFHLLFVFHPERQVDPQPAFDAKRVVATDPGSRRFQYWYSPTSGQFGEVLCGYGSELSRRIDRVQKREQQLERRRARGSNGDYGRWRRRNRRIKRSLAKERVRNQDWMRCAHYDAANFLLERHDIVIQPWLKVGQIVQEESYPDRAKTKLLGWSHCAFRQRLMSAAARYPGRYVLVSKEPGTSKTCGLCGTWKDDLALGDKTHTCEHCGVCVDRDLAGARNNFLAAYGAALGIGWDEVHRR